MPTCTSQPITRQLGTLALDHAARSHAPAVTPRSLGAWLASIISIHSASIYCVTPSNAEVVCGVHRFCCYKGWVEKKGKKYRERESS